MTEPRAVRDIVFAGSRTFFLMAGPCVIESREMALQTAGRLADICNRLDIPFIFKSSFDKGNRSSLASFRGPGIDEGLRTLAEVREHLRIPVVTDIHSTAEVAQAAEVADVLQIPAFLCRQTDLILAASRSGRCVNIKKGQFLAPWDMKNVIEKFTSTGNRQLIITERGSSFGYNNLVVDFRGLPIMRAFGYPVVFDVTHSLQLPGGKGDRSGGQREFAEPLARAAVAVGVDGLFMEVHPAPDRALCDGPNMIPLDDLEGMLARLRELQGKCSPPPC